MLTRLIDGALRNRPFTLIAFGTVFVMGAVALMSLSIDAVPDITGVQVVVNTKTGALDPEQIERSVTFPIETELAGISGTDEVRSLSKYGLSQVTIVFDDSTDIYWARQQVSERLQNIRNDLPAAITPQLGPISTGLGELFMYVVVPEPDSPIAQMPPKERLTYLRTVQDYTIRPFLKQVPGVADVDSNGGYKQEIHINLNLQKLAQYGLTFDSVITALEDVGRNYGGGYIERDNRQIIVRSSNTTESLKQIRNLPVQLTTFGGVVRVGDIAKVRIDGAQRVGAATYRGEQAVLGTALMLTGANSRDVARACEEKLSQVALPEGVRTEVLYSRSYLVETTVGTVASNLAEGAVLVILVLFLVLANIRTSVIVALTIPLSMLIAFLGMRWLGLSANLMSLGAVDFGLLVDATVVVIETYLVRLRENREHADTVAARCRIMRQSVHEVAPAVVTGMVIIMFVFIPILALGGIEGKMFRPLALVLLMALAASLFVGVLFLPVVAVYILKAPPEEDSFLERTFARVQNGYLHLLKVSLRHHYFWPITAVVVIAAAFVAWLGLGSDFIPELDEGDLVIGVTQDTRISLSDSIARQEKIEKEILKFGEVQTVFSRLGTPESATDPMGVNLADTFIILKKDRSLWPEIDGRRRSKDELFTAIRKELYAQKLTPEAAPTQPIAMRFNEMLEGSRADVSFRVSGPDLDTLLDLITRARTILQKVPGTESADFDALTSLGKSPVLDFAVNRDRVALFGLQPQAVNQLLQTAMSGYQVGDYYDSNIRFPVVVHLDEKFRGRPGKIMALPVPLDGGGTVRLEQVVDKKSVEQVTTIAHKDARRYASLALFISGRDIAGYVDESKALIDSELELPPGYSITWGGQFKNLETARQRLAFIVPAMLVVIFIILVRTFKSVRDAALIFSVVPFASAGGFMTLYATGQNFSISAAVGFIALTGIVILNALVLVNVLKQLSEQGLSGQELIVAAGRARFRPIFMTAVTDWLGFWPMAVGTGLGSEVQRPLATVVLGGIVTASLVTLFLLPSLYGFFERFGSSREN